MQKLKELYLRNRTKLIIAVSVLLILVALINIYFVLFVRVVSNDECIWTPKKVSADSTEIVFTVVKVGGVTWNAGIRDGDKLLAINHIPIKNVLQAQDILDSMKSGEFADYTIKKNGKIVDTKVHVKKLILIMKLANSLLAFMWMVIAFIVLMAKPDGKVQKLFYAIGVASVFSALDAIAPRIITGEIIKADPFDFTFYGFFFALGVSFLPFLLIAFFWIFPTQFKFWNKKWIKITLFAFPVILLILNYSVILSMLFDWGRLSITLRYTQNSIYQYIFIANVIALISLIVNYFKLKSRQARRSIIYILLALFVALVANIYNARVAPVISDSIFNSPEYYTPIILVILVPIAFAYSIFKYQLMDVSVVIKNTIMYATATVLIAATYFFVIYILGQTISEAIGTQYQGAIAGIVFILFALVFQSTKDKFQDFITAKFYPEQFAYQKVIVKFSNDVSIVVGLENILDAMQNTFVDALKLNNFGILLREKKANNLELVRSVGMQNKSIKLKDTNLYDFIKRKSLASDFVYIEQSSFKQVFPANGDELIKENIFTIIPMIIKSKVIGLLLFGIKHSGSQFAGKELELLHAAANQAAISIENARLYESEAEKLRIERDLDLARNIQMGLLPKCIPSLDRLDICGEMISAMQVGGDYYDLIQVSDTQLFVVVGDVSGKGLAASLYMAKLQTMVQLSCESGKNPREILIDINRKFYNSIARNSFVTITMALFDTEAGKVNFCRAGHMPLLMVMEGNVTSYRTQGIGIGLNNGDVFGRTLIQEELQLKSGQIFSFFSDGITEAMDEQLNLFGEEQLSIILKKYKNLNSAQIMDEIWNSVKRFSGDFQQHDDMTMVIVKVN